MHVAVAIANIEVGMMIFAICYPGQGIDEANRAMEVGEFEIFADLFSVCRHGPARQLVKQ